MQSISNSKLYAFDVEEYIFVDRLDEAAGINDNNSQLDDDSYDYCDDNREDDYNDDISLQPSEPPMTESIDMSKVVDDVLKNSILMKELDEAHAAASLDKSKQEHDHESKDDEEEAQASDEQEDQEMDVPVSDISATAVITVATEKIQECHPTPDEPSNEPQRDHLAKTIDSEVDSEEDATVYAAAASSATSRTSNKKRRKKLKLLKKAKAAENAAQALSDKPTRPLKPVVATKVNERKQASRKIRTLTTARSGRKVSNVAVACATETLTAFRKELIMKGQPCT